MPDVTSHEPAGTSLPRFLRERRGRILELWETAERRADLGRGLDRAGLLDSIPDLLERLAAGAAGGESADQEVARLVDAHQAERLGLGFDLAEVSEEYALLRQAVLVALAEAGLSSPLEEQLRLHRALDAAMLRPAFARAAIRNRTLEALDRIAAEAFAGRDVDVLLRRLLAVAIDNVEPGERTAILLHEGGELRVHAALGVGEAAGLRERYPATEGILGAVLGDGRPRTERIHTSDPLGLGPKHRGARLWTVLAVPLEGGGRPCGVATLATRLASHFTPGDEALFRALAERAGAMVSRARLHARLDAERARLEAVLRQLPVGVALRDLEGAITGNVRIEEILGGPADGPITLGDGRVQPPGDGPLARALRGETVPPEQQTIRRPDGDERHVVWSAAPVFEDGRPVAAAMVVQDHTERVRASLERDRLLAQTRAALSGEAEARDRLAESEARLEAFVENAPSVIFIKDLDGRYTFVNTKPFEELELTKQDYLGHDDLQVFGPVSGAAIRDNDLRVIESRSTLVAEEPVPRRDGTRTYLSVKFPLLDREGRPYALGGISTDITYRKRAEAERDLLSEASAALAESLDYEETLRKVVELGGTRFADYCLVDLIEDGAVRRLAVRARDPGRSRLLEQGLGFPNRPTETGPYAPAFRGEPVLIRRTGDEVFDALAVSPEHRKLLGLLAPRSLLAAPLAVRGKVFGLLVFGTTERELGPEDVGLAQELARRAALAIESARLYREAREAVRSREEFLSIAAHELKAPLAAAGLQLQTLRRGLEKGPVFPDRLDAGLARAVKQVQRLGQLLDHLLDLGRTTAGKLVLEREEVDAAELLREVVVRLSGPMEAAGCPVTVRAGRPEVAELDRVRIEQVLTNLLSNAAKYAPGTPVECNADGDEREVRLTVRDHGPGISPELLPRLFSPYQRAAGALSAGGVGLGLYISRSIAEAHGGTVEVESAPGEGATFTVRLPRRPTG